MRSGFKHIVTFVRNFLFSWLNKEFLIFLFFLALSGAFWLFNALNDTYEYEIKIPVQVTGVPRNVVITTGESDTLRVMVRDKGFAIASYLYGNHLNPVGLSFSAYGNANLGRGVVVSSELIRLIYPHLFSSNVTKADLKYTRSPRVLQQMKLSVLYPDLSYLFRIVLLI